MTDGGPLAADASMSAPDAMPEVPTWQALDLPGLGQIRDVVAVHSGEDAIVVVASDQGIFRIDADGVAELPAPAVAGGYSAVDFSAAHGLAAMGADGATLALGTAAGLSESIVFVTPTPYVELVFSPTNFIGLRSADTVAVYANEGGARLVPQAGLLGPYAAVLPEGPGHFAAAAEGLVAFESTDITWQTLPDGSALDNLTTLHLTAEGDIVGGDASGRLVERVGGAWRRFDGPTPGALRGGDDGPGGIVLVGDDGLVVRRMNGSWTQFQLPRTDDLVDVAATPGEPVLLTAGGELLWYGLPSQAPTAGVDPDAPDAGSADAGVPDAGPPPPAGPQLRVVSLNHGAVVDGCLDGRPLEGPYDRVGNQGGQIASGFQPINPGAHRFQTDVYFMPANRCRDIGEDVEFTARAGKLYLALMWELLGFGSVEVLSADVPPTDGATRARALGRSAARSARLELCIDGEPLPGDFGVVDRSSFSVEVRLRADASCQGELLGTAAVELVEGAATTLIAHSVGQSDDAQHALLNCVEVGPEGQIARDGSCRNVAVTRP
jgi:hypothetical protein